MAENEDELPPTNAQVLARFRRELLQHEDALARVRDALLRIGEGQSPEGPAADKAWTALGRVSKVVEILRRGFRAG